MTECFDPAEDHETSDPRCLHRVFSSYNENRRVMDFGYPKSISEDFPGVNTTINAAVYKEGEPEQLLLSTLIYF